MVEGVTRAKGLASIAREMGYGDISEVVRLSTDSEAAKQFVKRRGLPGKMKHIQVKDLWLQKEAREGRLEIFKILGTDNPADLMTKILSVGDIIDRLEGLNLKMTK